MRAFGWFSRELPRVAQRLSMATPSSALSPFSVNPSLIKNSTLRSAGTSQWFGGGPGGLAQVDVLAAKVDARDARQRQQAVDEASHVLGGVPHALQVLVSHGIEHAAVVLQEDLAEAVDSAERCPEIVGHRVVEGLEVAVRCFRASRARHDLGLGAPPGGYVARRHRSADDLPARVTNRRDRHRDVDVAAVLAPPDGLERGDGLPLRHARKERGLFVVRAARRARGAGRVAARALLPPRNRRGAPPPCSSSVTNPPRLLATIASPEDSTMAASCNRCSSDSGSRSGRAPSATSRPARRPGCAW